MTEGQGAMSITLPILVGGTYDADRTMRFLFLFPDWFAAHVVAARLNMAHSKTVKILTGLVDDGLLARTMTPPRYAINTTGKAAVLDAMRRAYERRNGVKESDDEPEPSEREIALGMALAQAIMVIEDYLSYTHDGDPWVEDARLMGEMEINEYERDGRLAAAKALVFPPEKPS